jgi:hypothetical protein
LDARDIEVQDAPAIMVDDKEAIQEAKGHRRHGEEIHSENHCAVIVKKRSPALR